MKIGIVIKTDGSTEDLLLTSEDGSRNTADIQKAIGGYMEAVRNGHGLTIFANEDGQRMNLPMNRNASLLTETTIVGNVVVVGAPNAAGDTGPLTDEQMNLVRSM